MDLTYIGPHDAVEVDLPDGRTLIVEHGSAQEFDDELAEQLLEQETNWAITAPKAPKKPSGAAASPEKE